MSVITRIRTAALTLPLKSSLRWGKGSRLDSLEHVLVRVETDSGQAGTAEAPARPTIYGETPVSIESIIRDHLAPRLTGLAINDAEGIHAALSSVKNNHTARGALDIAISEARAAAEGKTLLEAYAGTQRTLRTSFILGIDSVSNMVAEARRVFETGVHVFKTKVGRDWQHDLTVIRALQTEFEGEPVTLYADANEGLAPEKAARQLDTLAELGIRYVEEPLPVHSLKARARLKTDSPVPIIADDSCFSLRDLERELNFDTFDILNIKTARTGYSESLAMLKLARNEGKRVMLGSQAQSGLGTLHTAIFASRADDLPHELSFPLKLERDSLDKPLPYRDGCLALNDLNDFSLKPDLRAWS